MEFGNTLKELRINAGFTQKELADKLHMTPQAVSRYEQGLVEPNLDTIKEIAKVFNVSTDYLLNLENNDSTIDNDSETNIVEEEPQENNEKIVEVIKQPIAKCSSCGKLLFDGDEIITKEPAVHYRRGRTTRAMNENPVYYCPECAERIHQNEVLEAKQKHNPRVKKGYGFGISAGIVVLLIAIIVACNLTDGGAIALAICLGVVCSYAIFAFFICVFFDNNFIGDMWLEIAAAGAIRAPGVIFSLDLDGLAFLIVAKIAIAIFVFLVAMCFIALATAIASLLAIFVFPYAVRKEYKN